MADEHVPPAFALKPYPSPAKQTTVDETILDLMKKHSVVGLSAAVVSNNEVVWSNGYGWSDLEREIPVKETSIFRVASITKVVIATGLMQQYEQGKFQLDDDIGDYLGYPVRNPHFPEEKVTFRHLLTHVSSLQADEEDEAIYVRLSRLSQSSAPPSLREFLVPGGMYYDQAVWDNRRPGDPNGYAYSNLASMVVGTLLEKLSGQRLDQYCREHIFQPLGMIHSVFNLQEVEDMDSIGVLYEYTGQDNRFSPQTDNWKGGRPQPLDLSQYVPGTNGAIFGPQGSLRTNATDLCRFMLAHMNDGAYNGSRILREETAKLMHQLHWEGTGVDGTYSRIGLQLQLRDDVLADTPMIGHTGSAYGLHSAMYFDKEARRGIVFIFSGSIQTPGIRSNFYKVEEELIDALL